jgi:arylsulfatase A-like enzyme
MAAARTASALLALALGACGGAERDGGADAARPKNLLLISLDTLRPDHLGCYGHARDTSPALDALAARGVRFADVTAAAPWTLPSHATMLTGLYPSTHGVKNHETRLADSFVTLAEELAARGLRTLAVVNTFNVGAPQFQLAQGFQQFHYEPPRALQKDSNRGREVVAKAKELLAAGDAEQPFFLFLHFYDAHTDLTPRKEYRERFVEPYDGPLTGRTQELVALRRSGGTVGADDLRWLRQMYDAEIRQLDDLLGRFLAWLDERGMLADTLVVVTSDHGEEFQEHGSFLHGRTHFQEVLRIPLILAGPGVPAGRVVEEPVHGVDVVPTVLARMGVPSSVPRDGLDLSPLMHGGALPEARERLLFGEADHLNEIDGEEVLDVRRMVRRGSEKLLFDRVSGAVALHDLARDPGELVDLADERPERVAELRAALERFDARAAGGEAIPGPTAEELELLEELGYGGGDD